MLAQAAETLDRNRFDVSFSVVYLLTQEGKYFESKACEGLPTDHVLCRGKKELDSPESRVFRAVGDTLGSGSMSLIENLQDHCPDVRPGIWGVPPDEAVALPIVLPGHSSPAGCLLVGLNARKRFDDDYRAFLEMMARQLANNLAASSCSKSSPKPRNAELIARSACTLGESGSRMRARLSQSPASSQRSRLVK